MILHFTIHGRPVSWKRVTRGWNGSTFVPKDTKDYERAAFTRALQAVCGIPGGRSAWPLDAWYRCEAWLYTPDRRIPDCDNVSKAILDGCHGVLWANDRRVIAPHPTLVEVCCPEPRAEVTVMIIDPPRGWERPKRKKVTRG